MYGIILGAAYLLSAAHRFAIGHDYWHLFVIAGCLFIGAGVYDIILTKRLRREIEILLKRVEEQEASTSDETKDKK